MPPNDPGRGTRRIEENGAVRRWPVPGRGLGGVAGLDGRGEPQPRTGRDDTLRAVRVLFDGDEIDGTGADFLQVGRLPAGRGAGIQDPQRLVARWRDLPGQEPGRGELRGSILHGDFAGREAWQLRDRYGCREADRIRKAGFRQALEAGRGQPGEA
jgi:hypothetical protein